ncbi:MAG: hypothetical protein KDN19_21380 [Verrucomicrobiae bacterium]|nr:hypothetical protein [Verrucomicrobiae bacterium]
MPTQQNNIRSFLALSIATSIMAAFLASCASSGIQRVSNNDIYKDPDTKRLEVQEGMTRVTRELSENY